MSGASGLGRASGAAGSAAYEGRRLSGDNAGEASAALQAAPELSDKFNEAVKLPGKRQTEPKPEKVWRRSFRAVAFWASKAGGWAGAQRQHRADRNT
jgi:hypothetical protein